MKHVSKRIFSTEALTEVSEGLWITLWISGPRLPSGTQPVALRAASFRT